MRSNIDMLCLYFIGTTDARVAPCSSVFTRPFSNERVQNFRLLLITRERLDLATWNFDSSLRLMSCMFVLSFEAIGHVTSVLEPESRPASLAQKAVSVKNDLSTAKIFHRVVCLKIPFHPNQSTFGRDEVYFFFFSFFFSFFFLFFLFFLPKFCTLFFS